MTRHVRNTVKNALTATRNSVIFMYSPVPVVLRRSAKTVLMQNKYHAANRVTNRVDALTNIVYLIT